MKYIDADLLRKEVEKHIKEVKDAAERFTPNMGFFDAKLSGIYDVINIIDSLQQEQQEVDLEEGVQGTMDKDGFLVLSNGDALDFSPSLDKIAFDLQPGDKVRIIVMKEEEQI